MIGAFHYGHDGYYELLEHVFDGLAYPDLLLPWNPIHKNLSPLSLIPEQDRLPEVRPPKTQPFPSRLHSRSPSYPESSLEQFHS